METQDTPCTERKAQRHRKSTDTHKTHEEFRVCDAVTTGSCQDSSATVTTHFHSTLPRSVTFMTCWKNCKHDFCNHFYY